MVNDSGPVIGPNVCAAICLPSAINGSITPRYYTPQREMESTALWLIAH